jgi:hypothetical protein
VLIEISPITPNAYYCIRYGMSMTLRGSYKLLQLATELVVAYMDEMLV